MKKALCIALFMILTIPTMLFGQSYKQLWKQVEEAREKDLPQQVIKHAQQIVTKARKERQYGHLLKAQLTALEMQCEVAPDSLKPWVGRMEQDLRVTQDGALRAVYATLLARLYNENSYQLGDSSSILAKEYREMALADPALLARTKAKTFEPYVVKAKDSRYFGDDLLSLIGRTLVTYSEMHRQYVAQGNRPAACLSALWEMQQDRPYTSDWKQAPYIAKIDSLIREYGDLDVSGELAIERYYYMGRYGRATEAERLSYIHEATARWQKWPRMNQLRNEEQQMTNPQFEVSIGRELVNSTATQQVEIEDLRNVASLTMRIYKTTYNGRQASELDIDDEDDWKNVKKHLTLLPELTQTHNYTGRAPHEEFDDSMTIGQLPLGVYVIELEANSRQPKASSLTTHHLLYVSNLFVMNEPLPNEKVRFVVVDSRTGQPVSGAKLELDDKELTCDADGETFYSGRMLRRVYAYTDGDRGYCPTSHSIRGSRLSPFSKHTQTNLYTDRSIYRPGQTVFVAALVHETTEYINTQAVADQEVTLRLRDANYKVVEEKTVTTDKYGKASVEFVLPTGRLTGRYSIETGSTRQYFRVEEYKRPTYEVLFDDVTETYKAGDTLTVKGQARSYAGVGIQGATVKYTVKRRVAYWWLSYSRYWNQGYIGHGNDDTTIKTGELVTDANGRFSVDVPLQLPYGVDPERPMFYHFVVETDVTDQAGESHTGSTSVPLGTREKVLTCDLSEQVLKEEQKTFTFHLCNAAGNEIEGEVKYNLDNTEWKTVKAGTPIELPDLKSGAHTLTANLIPSEGEKDALETKFTVFSLDDTTPCTETDDWFYASATQFPNDGSPVTVQVGSSANNVHMVYSIIAGNTVIESGAVNQSNALWNKKFTYKDAYGTGLLLTFAWMKDGKLYTHEAAIKRPVPDKKLTLRWETFRDRLTPGQKEEWKLVVTNPDGTPADAQLMATMYDKSLEQLYSHHWSFTPYIYVPTPYTLWGGSSWGRLYGRAKNLWEPLEVKDMKFSHFDYTGWRLLGFSYYDEDASEEVVVGYGTAKRRLSRNAVMAEDGGPVVMAMAAEPMVEERAAEPAPAADNDEPAADEESSVQMRENLNETAFFYPTLTTDSEGRIAIKFTLPESLTTWRFMGIATTQDMNSGFISGEAVAQKEVMIQPNMPRFLRMGDKAQLMARIFNTSDHAVSGTAMLRLLDPETQKVVLKQSKPFSVKAGETAIATFDIDPSTLAQSSTLYICQVSASGKNFSDGEQHYLPILPNEERVTVTVPFTQHEPGTTSINIGKLFPAGTHQQKLTVEYTNNPAWLMVQALPSVGNPLENNAIDQAAWLYSNLIARTLVKQSTNIKTVFEQWKRESASDGSLTAQLAKNEELKDILLQETPWVVDADRETEQKLLLADFFDENTMDGRIEEATKKLRALQNGDGSWSWWPGMRGSFYMTVSIAEMLTRLNVMAGKQQETASMLTAAFRFMGKEIVEDVEEMKKWEKKNGKDYGFPSFKALQYLYICALDGRQLPKDVQKANDYLIGKMKKDIKNQTIYEKALSAIILQKIGEKKRSAEYAQSLKEYTVFTEEKGRYYDTPRAGYSWYDYKIPTEVMAIEALKMITPQDEQTVEEMQRWLLQEKRTQAWDTPINSVNAVYAFLFDNTKLLDAQEKTLLAIDGRPIELPKATAGIGYVKTAIDQPKGREFTAKKTSTGTSWGAVYAQFMQPVSEIAQSGSGITIKREVLDANGQQLTTNTLKVGDRIRVRITIESERDLDFVQVLDRRAACMEPVQQLSGYRNGAYCSPKDFSTNYYFDLLPKGKRVIETEYYIDRAGTYETGTCTIQCAYAPEYRATAPSIIFNVQK